LLRRKRQQRRTWGVEKLGRVRGEQARKFWSARKQRSEKQKTGHHLREYNSAEARRVIENSNRLERKRMILRVR